jgi:CO/xanthine dehydrogenase FAD-binding subunit
VALRHRATLGGNVVRSAPASDLIPILLALDAEVDLVGPQGDRRLLVDRFVQASRRTDLRPGELVRSVHFPEARPSAFLWQRVRPANDISQVVVAVAFSPARRTWNVAVGGVAPRPSLLPEAAALLGHGLPSPEAVQRAADSAAARSAFSTDRRASEEYRRRLVGQLLARTVGLVVRQPGFRP